MAGSFTETTVDHRVASSMPCNMELGPLAEAARGEDEELAAESSNLINKAFSIQAEVMALNERIKTGKIADYEVKRVDQLLLKANLEGELQGLNRQSTEFQNELARISGQLQSAINRLNEHLATKKSLIPALLLPRDQQAWEVKRDQLQANVDQIRGQQSELQITINAHNNDSESLAYRIKTCSAQAVALYHRLERLKGSTTPIYEPGSHGLAS